MSERRWTIGLVLIGAALLLAGCADVDIHVTIDGTPAAGPTAAVLPVSDTGMPVTMPTLAPTAVPTERAPAATATVPEPPSPGAAATPTAAAPSAASGATPLPAATQPPNPTALLTREPLRPTAQGCAAYQGTTYTLVWNEQQINAILDAVLRVAERGYAGTASVSLQNGQIAAQTRYSGPGGRTVEGKLVVAVSARDYDLVVQVIEAQVGQVGMTDGRKAAINVALENALETQMAQAHDYTCVDAVTIAGGTLTVVYH